MVPIDDGRTRMLSVFGRAGERSDHMDKIERKGAKPRDHASRPGKLTMRWVTWWPVRYWTERFNVLANRNDVELDIVFLGGRSAYLECSVEEHNWEFEYKYLSKSEDKAGYYAPKARYRNPISLIFPRRDIVVMNYGDPACVVAAIICRIFGLPYAIFAPNTIMDHRKNRLYKEKLKRLVFGGAGRILVTGPRQRDYATRYARDAGQIREIGNPAPAIGVGARVSTQSKEIEKERWGWEGEIVVLYVGRFSEEKGLLTLLKAMRRVKGEGLTARTVLVGSGPMTQALQALARDWSLCLEMPGFLEGGALASAYAAADVFVLPSSSEPWGLVVNEAMEFGLPLILSGNVGSVPVLLRESRNGFAFESGDDVMLASKLRALIQDRALRKAMGEESRRLVSQHTVQAWADAVLAALK